ncbi:MAG: DEAD/DEAH box helicase [Candidatus Scalindua sp. AMX11]|nr:MAG: ATP-dependent helicase [Candidatus Scalindua sp.]NOG82297.1 DEAD/DEAH box helicase [Planctomycetota bacterium]RZV65919.1 MAG: DEAD/DEAH box helicase [Candidatus Scalindua sp. SCAELEC01]TDE63578.1 MAG: DEAD/DEAH box helicase [Candidatus Scalindua sp. AMX11]
MESKIGSFEDLGLSERALTVLKQKGFEEPTPIQAKTIPAILSGNRDIVGQAQTGTGKTAAFGLPIIELLPEKSKVVQALVLAPTRELATQVAEEINSLKGKKKLSVIPIYGGQSMDLQLRSLKKGIDIVVGTPGRVLDHLKRRTLKLDKISYLVLDEADEMLNMGFLEDVSEILEYTAPDKRTMLFSATMPPEIIKIAKKHMGEYDILKVTKGQLTANQTDQIYFEVSAADKFEALCRIIDIEEEFYGLVFCRTKINVDTVANHLMERGYDADALHGDMSQSQREKILIKFKKQMLNILVATDVAARGIDVQNLTHVINFSLPQDPESYVHRIGRTGRAGKGGNAITFITPEEYRKLQFIKREAKTDIRKAKLPKVADVIETKKNRIKSDLDDIVNACPRSGYLDMSRELLINNDPVNILAALLQYAFLDELDEESYTKIKDAVVVDTKGKTRLFVTHGKQDGFTRKKLITVIKDKCGISNEKIRDVQILDKFSFVTLPFHEAETLLSYFKKSKKGGGPFFSKAKKIQKKRN